MSKLDRPSSAGLRPSNAPRGGLSPTNRRWRLTVAFGPVMVVMVGLSLAFGRRRAPGGRDERV